MPHKKPLVSVILPTYNRAWILEDAVKSVLAQDFPNIELIIIDDGSEDETADILDFYKNSATIIRQENKGVSTARNTGIKSCNGSLIALLDSDDAWDKKKISCQVSFFNQNTDAMICQTEEIWIRNGRRVNPKKKHKKLSGMIFEPSLHLCLVSPSAVMMRRELLEHKGLFNESFTVCEDYDLWLRISATEPVYLIDKPLTIKRGGHRDQLSRFHSQDKFRIRSLLSLIQSNQLTKNQLNRAKQVLKEKCSLYGNGCKKRGRLKEAEHYLNLKNIINNL